MGSVKQDVLILLVQLLERLGPPQRPRRGRYPEVELHANDMASLRPVDQDVQHRPCTIRCIRCRRQPHAVLQPVLPSHPRSPLPVRPKLSAGLRCLLLASQSASKPDLSRIYKIGRVPKKKKKKKKKRIKKKKKKKKKKK